MYLDKPLRAHTLFQAVTRTNRRWTNPMTGQEKLNGLIVDYIGLGSELAKAVAVKDTGTRKALPAEVDDLVRDARRVHRHHDGAGSRTSTEARRVTSSCLAAQDRLASAESRGAFAEEFLRCQGLFELLWPDTRLRPVGGRLPLVGAHLCIGHTDAWTRTRCSGIDSARRPVP